MTFPNNPGPGYTGPGSTPGSGFPPSAGVSARPVAVEASTSYLSHAFMWMFAGLLLTAAVSLLVQGSDRVQQIAADAFLPVIIGQLVLVMIISWGIRRINATVALGLFFVYAASLGLTVGLILTAYNGESVGAAFLTAAGMFGGAALYGMVTKRSLAGIGGFLTMALIGLIVAMVVNAFLASSGFTWLISLFGVGLFTVLTAYHVQQITSGRLVVATGSVEKAAVLGALSLYLDFVNLFLMLLRLFGGGRR